MISKSAEYSAAQNVPPAAPAELAADVGHQAHEPSSLNGLRDRMLAGGVAAGLATTNNPTMTVGQLAQQVEILVVDEHGTGNDPIDRNRIFLDDLTAGSWFTLRDHLQIHTRLLKDSLRSRLTSPVL